jgi:hypothetical protein
MPYQLKTYWPFPLCKKYCEDEDQLLVALEEIIEFTEKFYEEKGVDIDTDHYLLYYDGLFIMKIDPEAMHNKKMKDHFLKNSGITVTSEMYRLSHEIRQKQESSINEEGKEILPDSDGAVA